MGLAWYFQKLPESSQPDCPTAEVALSPAPMATALPGALWCISFLNKGMYQAAVTYLMTPAVEAVLVSLPSTSYTAAKVSLFPPKLDHGGPLLRTLQHLTDGKSKSCLPDFCSSSFSLYPTHLPTCCLSGLSHFYSSSIFLHVSHLIFPCF